MGPATGRLSPRGAEAVSGERSAGTNAVGIEARGLTKSYRGVAAIDGISFSLPPGSRTALLGANGAGKSTLLHTLATLVAPTGGSALLGGEDVAEAPARLRRQVGFMGHVPMLYEELTPSENLRFFARLYDVEDGAKRADELLRAVGLWTRRDEPTAVLSRGMHQRLALARAVLHRPRVLLLDEPETGLDAGGIDLLERLALRDEGVTVLAATHRAERVGRWATRRLVLDRGRVVGDEETAVAERGAEGVGAAGRAR